MIESYSTFRTRKESASALFSSSCFVSQTLPYHTAKRSVRTITVVAAKGFAIVIPKLEFGQIAMQIGFAAMLINTLHAALEDAEIAFDCVAVDGGHLIIVILTGAVVGSAVRGEMMMNAAIDVTFVGHDNRFARYVRLNNRHDGCSGYSVHNHRPSLAGVAVDQRQHLHLMVLSAHFRSALDATDESLVNLDDTTARTERGKVARAHRFTDAIGQKPRAPIGDLQNTVQLMRRNTLLAGNHQVGGLQHLVQRDAGVLKHGADLRSELALAVTTAPQAFADALSRVRRHFG